MGNENNSMLFLYNLFTGKMRFPIYIYCIVISGNSPRCWADYYTKQDDAYISKWDHKNILMIWNWNLYTYFDTFANFCFPAPSTLTCLCSSCLWLYLVWSVCCWLPIMETVTPFSVDESPNQIRWDSLNSVGHNCKKEKDHWDWGNHACPEIYLM